MDGILTGLLHYKTICSQAVGGSSDLVVDTQSHYDQDDLAIKIEISDRNSFSGNDSAQYSFICHVKHIDDRSQTECSNCLLPAAEPRDSRQNLA